MVDIVEGTPPAPTKRPKTARAEGDEIPKDSAPDMRPGRREARASVAPSAANDKLASTATSVLCGYNRIASIGASVVGLEETGNAIWNGNDEFSDLAFEALRDDPALAKRIASVTAGSPGMLGLIIAYAALGSAVAGVAREELAAKRAARKPKDDGDDGTRPANT